MSRIAFSKMFVIVALMILCAHGWHHITEAVSFIPVVIANTTRVTKLSA